MFMGNFASKKHVSWWLTVQPLVLMDLPWRHLVVGKVLLGCIRNSAPAFIYLLNDLSLSYTGLAHQQQAVREPPRYALAPYIYRLLRRSSTK